MKNFTKLSEGPVYHFLSSVLLNVHFFPPTRSITGVIPKSFYPARICRSRIMRDDIF